MHSPTMKSRLSGLPSCSIWVSVIAVTVCVISPTVLCSNTPTTTTITTSTVRNSNLNASKVGEEIEPKHFNISQVFHQVQDFFNSTGLGKKEGDTEEEAVTVTQSHVDTHHTTLHEHENDHTTESSNETHPHHDHKPHHDHHHHHDHSNSSVPGEHATMTNLTNSNHTHHEYEYEHEPHHDKNHTSSHPEHHHKHDTNASSNTEFEDDEADEDTVETVRIQDILRQIFVDELEHTTEEEDDFEEQEEPFLNDASSRSELSVKAENKTGTVSRQGRANNDDRRSPSSRGKASSSAGKRNVKGNSAKGSGKPKGAGSDFTKYNAYMDAVLKRMNLMIKSKRMDPLRVNLYAGPSKKKAGAQPSSGGKKNKYSARMNLDSTEEDETFTEDEEELDEIDDQDGPASRDIFINRDDTVRSIRALLANVTAAPQATHMGHSDDSSSSDEEDNRSFPDTAEVETPRASSGSQSSASNKTPKKPKSPQGGNNTKTGNAGVRNKNKKNGSKEKNSPRPGVKNSSTSTRNKNKNAPRPTRGILHGLSTLRRDGDVQVIRQNDKARIVRAKFLLGPVALEILPRRKSGTNTNSGSRGGRGNQRKSVAASATAPQLKGVLEVRLKQGNPTRIRKLRVYPPSNVKVGGSPGKPTVAGAVSGRGYNKVTPMATARLRQVAMQVVRHADRLKH